jgi:hypothetical protein
MEALMFDVPVTLAPWLPVVAGIAYAIAASLALWR